MCRPLQYSTGSGPAGLPPRLPLPESGSICPSRQPSLVLAVALGGAGISLVDLVRLYAALSNAGEVAPLRYRPNDAAARGAPIFGPLAAWYVNDILAEAPPPGVLPVEVRRGRR